MTSDQSKRGGHLSRRDLIAAAPSVALLAGGASGLRAEPLISQTQFAVSGTYLDAAFTHPFGTFATRAAADHARERSHNASRFWPVDNPRNKAVEAFAGLVNASPADIAVVPSTMEGENLICQALGIGPAAGVVTDAFHYDASLVLYAEARRQGTPVGFVKPRKNRIELGDIAAAITPQTRLIAVSLVSGTNGYFHDLKALCEMAHSRGILVYADAIQSVGAVPVDVRDTGVDFLCAGTYKWLMGDFGTAFLYVRPDRLDRLRRVQLGWRQVVSGPTEHFLPYDSPGPMPGAYSLRPGAAGLFEVSSPSYGPLAIAAASLAEILRLGVANIAAHRRPLTERLQQALPRLGFIPLTRVDRPGPIVCYALKNAKARLDSHLAEAKVKITLQENRIRVSPSVYNRMDDIELLIDVLKRALKA